MAMNVVAKIDRNVKINHVLISVSDKQNLEILVPGLLDINPHIRFYSTGGTYAQLQKILGDRAKENLIAVSEYTGQPEMQGGLVKTLDFKIYLGLLSETYNEAHAEDLKRVGAVKIDMVVVNLYPFSQTVANPDVTLEEARGNIDIGGPCMVRASAKNFISVASVVDPTDYEMIIKELTASGGEISFELRFRLAKKAFAHTAGYDTAIATYLDEVSVQTAQKTYDLV